MTLQSFLAYMRQPSSITGVSAICGAFVAFTLHQVTALQAVPVVITGVLAIVLKDNTSTILHQAQANGAAIGAASNPNAK